jgi:RNA polymerase sigma-70 factor (ECF subfamily)
VPEASFQEAYPLALRAARVRSAAAVVLGAASAADREDLEQEALLQVWQALPRYDASRASLRTFVERVADSRFRSMLRPRRRQVVVEPWDGNAPPSPDGIPAVEFRADLDRILRRVGAPDRRLALLLTEHTPSEASRILGVARSTIYSRIRRLQAAFGVAGYGPWGACGRPAMNQEPETEHRVGKVDCEAH